MRLIDADCLKRKAQKESTVAWKMKIKANVETILNQFIDWIDNAPTIEPEQKWIPCSERLPEIGKEVLLSEPNAMFIAEYHGSGDPEGLWLINERHHYLADVNGCAWMPLPEQYREEEDMKTNK